MTTVSPLHQALYILGPARRLVPLWIATFTIVALMEAAGIGLVFPFILSLVSPETIKQTEILHHIQSATGLSPETFALAFGIAVGALFVTKNLLTILLIRWQFTTLFKAEAAAGVRLYQRYLDAPWSVISARNSSEMVRNATSSLSVAMNSVIVPSMTLLVESVVALAIAIILFIADYKAAGGAVAFTFLASMLYYGVVRNRLQAIGVSYQEAISALMKQVKEGVGAGREIRVLGRTDGLMNAMHNSRERYARAVSRKSFLLSLPRYYLEIVLVVSILLLITSTVANRGAIAAMPVLALFAIAAIRLLTSASRILSAIQQIRIGLPALKAVYDDLTIALEAPPRPQQLRPPPQTRLGQDRLGITIQGVNFRYDEGRHVLRDIELSIPQGSSLGIVGASGSGKSTLIDIILGLIIPQNGRVLIDGCDLKAVASEWRSRIGYVPQTIYLIDDTLKRNVALGLANRDIDDIALARALQQANLADFVSILPKGVDTSIGELGAFLSGGQRQRIGIARALYHDPDALILDEATSALDEQTERAVLEAVFALSGKKTIIVVAHRPNTVSYCDRVIVLADGRIVESGTFEELTLAGTYLSRDPNPDSNVNPSKDDT